MSVNTYKLVFNDIIILIIYNVYYVLFELYNFFYYITFTHLL